MGIGILFVDGGIEKVGPSRVAKLLTDGVLFIGQSNQPMTTGDRLTQAGGHVTVRVFRN